MVPVRLFRFAAVLVLAVLALTLRASAARADDEVLPSPPAEILAEVEEGLFPGLTIDSITVAQAAPIRADVPEISVPVMLRISVTPQLVTEISRSAALLPTSTP